MDSDARAADRLSSADDLAGSNSSCKLARTDTFPLRMQLQNHDIRGSLVRSNSSSVLPDCRLGYSSTSNVNRDALLISTTEPNYGASDVRLLRNESLISASRALALHQQQQQQLKSSALLSAYGEMERGAAALLLQQHQSLVFTPSQLRELQLHALIFKHMVCGVNVPPELVLLVRTSVASLAGMTTGAAHLGSLGWGNYHLGYGNSVDPEPGRCRRTDGKKWRCARDVVPDQKYCERHMHRGRHRARKPPEPLSSPVASATVSPASSTVTALQPRSAVGTPSSSPTTSFLSATKSPSSFPSPFHLQQQLALQAARSLHDDEHRLLSDSRGLSQGPSPAVSGLSVVSSAVSSPLDAIPCRPLSFLGAGAYESTGAGLSREPEGQHLRHFFDDWPRGRDPASLTWPNMEGEHPQRPTSSYGGRSSSKTQLSISIPNMQADQFGTNGSTPRGGKLALSPLKLSMSRGEEDPLGVEAATQMGLGVGLGVNETERQRQSSSSWVPIAWETSSVGGPLAEVLQSSSNTPRGGADGGSHAVRGSGLNLMPDAWESSPRSSPPSSSPTGVLQISATFGCFSSDNSTASSPRSAALKQPTESNI
ncbi:hypothetical protein L7F22_000420 [Adiantum nelumboides]|nr:hypothetical protein [Adiantum nelumboides]